MVPEPTREISKAGEASPAEVHVAERHWRGQRGVQPSGEQREGRGSLPEKSSDATRQLQQRPLLERGEAADEPESREREAHDGRLSGRQLAPQPGKQRRWRGLGLLQSQALLRGATTLSVGPAAPQDREPLLIVRNYSILAGSCKYRVSRA